MAKLFEYAIEFLSGIIAFLFIVITFLCLSNYRFSDEQVEFEIQNWGKGPIMDIKDVPTTADCPKGYELLFTNKFAGYNEGCNCYDSEGEDQGKIYATNCTKSQLKQKCEQIEKVDDIELSIWKQKKLCIKRSNEDFWELMKKIPENECPANTKQCGILDSKNNLFCLNNNEECPINYIEIINKKETPKVNNNDVKKVDLGDDNVLYFSNTEKDGKLFVDFYANTHNLCFINEQGHFGENNYILNAIKGKGECVHKFKGQPSLFDERFIQIDSMPYKEFYDSNSITKALNYLSDYPYPENNSTVNLYYSNYFGWDPECAKLSDRKYSREKLFELDIKKTFDVVYVVGILSVIYVAFVIGTFALFVIITPGKEKNNLFIIIKMIKILVVLVMLILSAIAYSKTKKNIRTYKDFINHQCADVTTGHSLYLAFKYLLKTNPLLIVMIIFTIIEIILKV